MQIRCMQQCFLHSGMRSLKACARKITLITGNFKQLHCFSSREKHLLYCLPNLVIFFIFIFHFTSNCCVFREMDLLSMPSNRGSLRLVQWPLFLLSSKVEACYFIYFYLYKKVDFLLLLCTSLFSDLASH